MSGAVQTDVTVRVGAQVDQEDMGRAEREVSDFVEGLLKIIRNFKESARKQPDYILTATAQDMVKTWDAAEKSFKDIGQKALTGSIVSIFQGD
ncbi:MAG: hypothetical protein C4525_13795, partial [Desulfarculus sp.]